MLRRRYSRARVTYRWPESSAPARKFDRWGHLRDKPAACSVSLVFKYSIHFFPQYFRLPSKHLPIEFISLDTNNRWQPSSNKYLNIIFLELKGFDNIDIHFVAAPIYNTNRFHVDIMFKYNNDYGLNLFFFLPVIFKLAVVKLV